MTTDLVTFEMRGPVALIGLNRAEKRNAISDALRDALHGALVAAQTQARVVVLHGHGPHFCAGADLSGLAASMQPGAAPRKRGTWHPMAQLIARGEVPVVVAITGACIGGGLELAAAAQIRVADGTAFFALPEPSRGIYLGGGGSVHVQKLIGYARMADMMLTGRVIPAAEAEAAGICQYVVPEGAALDKALALAERIARNAPLANWAVCAGLPRQGDMGNDDGLFIERLIGAAIRSDEGPRRLADFLDGRAESLRPDAG